MLMQTAILHANCVQQADTKSPSARPASSWSCWARVCFTCQHAHCAGVAQIDRVVEAVEETLKGNTVHLLAKKQLPSLDLPKVWVTNME